MKKLCLYLHVHQPHRLRKYRIFDIGNNSNYFDEEINEQVFDKVSYKSYLPLNNILLNLLNRHDQFKVNLSITGVLLEQAEKYNTNVLDSFISLTNTNKTEILAETYYHSLASLYSPQEFARQVDLHKNKIFKIFGQKPKYFRNTELIYSNYIASMVEEMGFKGIIAEGTEKILHWRSPNYLYKTNTNKGINLMLKNYKLSDDIAWRFSNKGWVEHPLSSEKYLHWLDNTPGETINLFMDYETFGEHQWEDTGIFNFFEHFVSKAIERGYEFINFKDIEKTLEPKEKIDCPFVIS